MNSKTKKIGESYEKLYSELPESMGLQCNIQTSSSPSTSDRTEVSKFLNRHVPESERKEIDSELKKTFPLRTTKIGKINKLHPPRRSSSKYLSSKERRKLGLFRLLKSKHELKYSDFANLNGIWRSYMRNLLDLENYKPRLIEDPIQTKLCRADYHGALIKVTKSPCQSYVGTEGFVVMETRNTFQIIDVNNHLKIVPKNKSSFSFTLDGYLFTIGGSIMGCKPSERAVKKWKNKYPYDL